MEILHEEVTKSGAWFGDNGQQQFVAQVPDGFQYESHNLNVSAGNADVTVAPSSGDTGELVFWVEWSYGWFGAATFQLTVEADEIPVDTEPSPPPKKSNQSCSMSRAYILWRQWHRRCHR